MTGYKTPTFFFYDIKVEDDGDTYVTKVDPNFATSPILVRVDSLQKLRKELEDYGFEQESIDEAINELQNNQTVKV